MTNAIRPVFGGTAARNAETRVRDRLRRHEHSAEAGGLWLRLGFCLAAQDLADEARNAFEEASTGDDPDVAVRALLQLRHLGEPDGPITDSLKRLAKNLSAITHPAAAVDIAVALVSTGQRLLAVDLLKKVLSTAPAPAPRGNEHPTHRRVQAVAALRLAELRAEDPVAGTAADELFQRAVDANDPGVTPVAALSLARRHGERMAEESEELLRIAWAYDHPQASSVAGRQLAELCASLGQTSRALEFLDALVVQGDEETAAWAMQRRGELRSTPRSDLDDRYGGLRAALDNFRRERGATEDLKALVSSGARRLAKELHRRNPVAPQNVERLIRDRLRLAEPNPINTLIIGAGSGARRLVREVSQERATIAGLIDDYITTPVGGHEVIGRIDDLPQILVTRKIGQVILAIPSASPELHNRVAMCCAPLGVWLRVLPNPFELLSDREYIHQLRPLRVEETFGRDDPVVVDHTAGDVVRGKSVLIVGAGGSIGSELARQVIRSRPAHLTLVDRADASLLRIAEELKEQRRFAWTFAVLADAVNRHEMRTVLQTHRPDVVFIASGISHAHLADDNIMHAARVNVIGPWICSEEAIRARSERVVLVSGASAVRRRGPFDWSKALAERAVLSPESGNTTVCAVRISNVFRTSGSVVERLDRQVHYGGPLTLSHAESRRYLSLHEAAQWLLRVAAIAAPRTIYAVDAGVEVDIVDLATRLIRLRGLEPTRDVRVVVRSQLRGEKAAQNLWGADERWRSTALPNVGRIQAPDWDADEALSELRRVESITDATPDSVERLLRRSLGLLDPSG